MIKDWMVRDVITVTPRTSVKDAFSLMKKHNIRHLPVLRAGQLVGIVSDRNLRRPDCSDQFHSWDDFYRIDDVMEVEDVMTTNPMTIAPNAEILQAAIIMIERKFGALPVVDQEQHLVGIITVPDILKALVASQK